MRAGALITRISIRRNVPVQDTSGQPIENWVELASVWADKKDLRGTERFQADQVVAGLDTVFKIRYFPGGVTPLDRIVCNDVVYDIHSVVALGQNDALEISASARAEDVVESDFVSWDVLQAEADILIALYAATGGSSWTESSGWTITRHVADWAGVTVSGSHVTEIDLGTNGMTGVLPASVGSLPEVTYFDFTGNTLTGLGAFIVALAASVAANDREGVVDISGETMQELTWGTEAAPSATAAAVMALLAAGWVLIVEGDNPEWI